MQNLENPLPTEANRSPWNKGKLTGAKPPLRPKHVWSIRTKKTGQPVKFELTEQTRQAVDDYLRAAGKRPGEFLFSGRRGPGRSMSTKQYARLVSEWIASIGLDPHLFGTHSLRRTRQL
jgi:integrase